MKHTLVLGVAIAVAVAGLELAGGFRALESKTIDVRSNAPRPHQPLSDQVALVVIDDGAIDRIGRWPWSRATLADLIDEIRLAGARTIALDLLLSDESDEDDRLAAAIERADCGLPVVIHQRELYDGVWQSPEGSSDLRNLLKVLGEDVQLDRSEDVLARAKIGDAVRSDRYRMRPLEFKRAAAWNRLQHAEGARSFEDFERLVAPRKEESVRDYPELATLRAVWRQFDAWRKLRSRGLLVALLDRTSQGTFRDQAPILRLAERVGLVGYANVDRQRHADGILREFDPLVGAQGGFVLQYGIAAAVRHLGLSPADVSASEYLLIGRDALPLRGGRLWINWPRSDTDPRWLGLVMHGSPDAADQGPIPRTLLDLAGDRRKHAGNRAELARLTGWILGERDRRAALEDEPLSPEHRREVRDEASFLLDLEPGATLTANHVPARGSGTARRGHVADPRRAPAQLQFVDRCARWLEIDGLPEAEQEALRAEWAELTVDIRLALREPDWRSSLLSEETLAQARHEVRTAPADPRTDDRLAALWQDLEEEVRRGDQLILEQARQVRRRLEDKLVFVGAAWTGFPEIVPTPVDPSTPGVVVHAVVAGMVLENRPVRFLAGWQSALLALGVGMLLTLVPYRLSPLPSATAALAGAQPCTSAGAWWLFAAKTFVVPLVGPLCAAVSAWTACTVLQAATIRREHRRITRQFKARVSDRLVERLAAHADELTVSGEEREVAVLFADLANFTSISEALGERRTVSTLNLFLGALVEVLIKDGTYVNKFLGDGLMAFWSAFDADPQQAVKACRSALECQRVIEPLSLDARFNGLPRIGLRLGIATGRAVVGDCGAPPALSDYTVIGSTVNLAARLESANKQFGTRILINGRTRELIEDTSMLVRPMGRIVVAGQQTPVKVFELLPPDASKELIEITERAVNAFATHEFEEARRALDELEHRFGPSGLANVYREAMAGAGEVFDGVLHLQLK